MVVAQVRLALEQLLDQLGSVERQRERLANLLVGELALVRSHPDLAMEGCLESQAGEVRVVQEGLA